MLSLWYHGAGNEVESAILNGIIDDFNASQSDYFVEVQDFPQESYNESIVAAALADDLPDIIDMDGPVMPNWAWAGYVQPLSLSEGALDGFLPGAIGVWDDQVYSVGLWDAAIAVYARQSQLERDTARVRIIPVFICGILNTRDRGCYKRACTDPIANITIENRNINARICGDLLLQTNLVLYCSFGIQVGITKHNVATGGIDFNQTRQVIR